MESARESPLGTLGTIAFLAVLSGLATWLVYGHTVDYGFSYDDYVLIRPYTTADVARSFHSSWDTTGVMVPFYRPITVAFHALRFELFGLDSRAHHFVSLFLFACCAALTGWLSYRVTRQAVSAPIGTLMFVAHPAMPYALVAWITNQMHLIETLTVLVALAWWHAVRGRPVRWWLPLLLFGAIAFLIKEDGIMLLPAIIALHGINRWLHEPHLPAVPRAFMLGAALLLGTLLFVRDSALGGLGGYGRPSPERAWQNYIGGLVGTLRLTPADRPWQPLASGFATCLPIIALALWRRAGPGSRVVLTSGFVMALLFNLPFVLVSKAEQMHLVASGAVLFLAGSALALLSATSRPMVRGAALVTIAAGIAACAAVARDITSDFEPSGPVVRATDDIVRSWSMVPAQIHDYLARKRATGSNGRISPNPIDELSHVTFGAHGIETSPDDIRYQWMAQPVVDIFVFRPVGSITIPLRHDVGAFREPAVATIDLDGRRVDEVRLDSPDWRQSRILPGERGVGRRVLHIRISIDHVWYPARTIPRSTDHRALGLQIGELTLR